MHLEEEPLARHFPGAGKLLGTHSKGTCPIILLLEKNGGFANI